MTDNNQLVKRGKFKASKASQFMVKIPRNNELDLDVSNSDESIDTPLLEQDSSVGDNGVNCRNSLQLHINSMSSNKKLGITGYTKRVREVEITMTQNHTSSFDNSCPLENPFIAGGSEVDEKPPDVKQAIDLTSNVTFIKWCDELNSIQEEEQRLIKQLFVERYKLYMRYDLLNKVLTKYASQLSAENNQLSEKFEHIKKTFSDILSLTV
ncbi:hypothetical protein CANMA_004960 [Candida margitis]|uniref:uncharacterized protein n=1 Tax=Candida margitis TaxID=1775924 RepID=UPI0022277268|nr:uncharacterized protein CANMA_004960 [Candida margitis]KAI5954121.1 hypothetical protein CANMA_004960 [Candida margitis]